MSVPVVSPNEVQTQDASATSEPYKISHLRPLLTVVMLVECPDFQAGVGFMQLVRGGSGRKVYDDLLFRHGMVCGMECRAGYENTADGRNIRARPLQVPYNSFTFGGTFSDFDDLLPAAEGDYVLRAYALNNSGWSV